MIRVVVADDQQMVRAGLKLILASEQDITVVGEAVDGAEAVTLAGRLRPDVLLMDVRMPRVDGITATRRIVAAGGPTNVVVLTTFDVDSHVYDALRAGASGFLLKSASPEDLVHAIRVAAAGAGLIDPAVTRRVIAEFTRASRPVEPPAAYRSLTDREREILAYVARGWNNAEIAASLVVSEATVKTHVARILAKLGLRDRVQVVVFAYEHGLAVPGELAGE